MKWNKICAMGTTLSNHSPGHMAGLIDTAEVFSVEEKRLRQGATLSTDVYSPHYCLAVDSGLFSLEVRSRDEDCFWGHAQPQTPEGWKDD